MVIPQQTFGVNGGDQQQHNRERGEERNRYYTAAPRRSPQNNRRPKSLVGRGEKRLKMKGVYGF